MSCLNENGFNLWCNAHLKYNLWCAALNTSQLFWGAVPCSITPPCSLGPRIKWPLSHWSTNLTTWATASYKWCCDNAITFIMITSECANAEKIWTHKSRDMWAAKCAAKPRIWTNQHVQNGRFILLRALKTSILSALLNHLPKLRWKKNLYEQRVWLLRNASSQSVRTTGCKWGSRENKHWKMSFLNTWCFSQPQIPKFARDTAKPIHSRPTCHFTLEGFDSGL